MTFLKTMIDTVQEWLEDEGDEEEVIHSINRAIRKVEKIKDWEVLKDNETQTPDSDGIIYEPATNRVIRRVYPEGSYDLPTSDFRPKAEQDQLNQPTSNQNKLLSAGGNKVQLSASLTVDIVQNSTTVTQATASADSIEDAWVGERFQVEGDETVYEIISVVAATSMVVYPDIRRTTGSSLVGKVRPIGQAKYKLTDCTGKAYTGDVDIAYQRTHPQLLSYNDQLLIPAEELVSLLAVKFFLHQTKYDVDARQLKLDIDDARRIECNQEATASPEHIGAKSTFSVRSHRNNRTIR